MATRSPPTNNPENGVGITIQPASAPMGTDNAAFQSDNMLNTPSNSSKPTSGPESMTINKKELKKMTSIEQAKDRAQVTAATSMSVVHVALLKDLLDTGSAGNPYYNWILSFLLTALILQIVAGFISLYIALLRYYFTEYRDDFLDDCMKTCCPWRCRRIRHDEHISSIKSWITESSANNNVITNPKLRKPSNSDENIDDDEECKETPGCCPFDCTTIRYAEYEYTVLNLYDKVIEENIKADLLGANYDIEIAWLTEKASRLKAELERYKSISLGDAPANEKQLQKIEDEIEIVNAAKLNIMERNKNAREYKAQADVLEKHVERIQEERVLKRSTFWQNWLNMMMYTVFILNVIIAGMGMASPPAQDVVTANLTAA